MSYRPPKPLILPHHEDTNMQDFLRHRQILVEDTMSREEAARHAARARWKGHVKADPEETDIYNKTFFAAHPHLEGKVVVHHAVERQIVDRYPGIWTDSDMHLLTNLRGIPKTSNDDLHLSRIRVQWNTFYRTHHTATRKQVLDWAKHIDTLYGKEFDPPL